MHGSRASGTPTIKRGLYLRCPGQLFVRRDRHELCGSDCILSEVPASGHPRRKLCLASTRFVQRNAHIGCVWCAKQRGTHAHSATVGCHAHREHVRDLPPFRIINKRGQRCRTLLRVRVLPEKSEITALDWSAQSFRSIRRDRATLQPNILQSILSGTPSCDNTTNLLFNGWSQSFPACTV